MTEEKNIMESSAVKERVLRAGKLSARFENGRMLDICCGGRAVVSEIYFALRDYNWGTVPYEITDCRMEQTENTFHICFHAVHGQEGMRFHWDGVITGSEDSKISYRFTGEAEETLLKNRIGFCVLHPSELAGEVCTVLHSDGGRETGAFPYYIAPHQPFFDICAIEYPVGEEQVSIEFEGDIFEMEDQRNWTDVSFKTYCTPLDRPFPVRVERGENFTQSVTICLAQKGASGKNKIYTNMVTETKTRSGDGVVGGQAESVTDKKDRDYFNNTCSLGHCITEPLTETQMKYIQFLQPSHLRYDYHFGNSEHKLAEIAAQAKKLGCRLLLATFFSDSWRAEAEKLKTFLADMKETGKTTVTGKTETNGKAAVIEGILLLPERGNTLRPEALSFLTAELAFMGVPIGSGTDAFFTQLNRERICADGLSFVSYSNNPQVHAFDEASMMSTAEGQRANVQSCRALYPQLPVAVSPVSMKMRWNPDATGEMTRMAGQLPADIDARQTTLFAASWAVRSAAVLLQERVKAATYFELTGEKGLLEKETCHRDFAFPSVPGMIYPLYYAMMFLHRLKGTQIFADIRQEYTKIFWEDHWARGILAANHTDCPIEIWTEEQGRALFVDETFMAGPGQQPKSLQEAMKQNSREINGRLILPGYSVALIDFTT